MITLLIKDKSLCVNISSTDYSSFSDAIKVLKNNKFRYDASLKSWLGPWFKFEEIKSRLEDFDVIDNRVKDKELIELKAGEKEQFSESTRRIPDYSLMNYGPITGKEPHENFQKIAITKGINKSSYCYFYGQGSGKSYIAAAIIAHRKYKYKDCNKVVFITTNIGVRNLYHELFKFIKDLDPNKVRIADKNYRNPFDDPNIDIVITSYNGWRLICDYYLKKLKITSKNPRKSFLPLKQWANNERLMLILDESHCIANPTSKQSHLIALHSPLFTYRYEFSGTPADKPEKLWQQYNVIDPYLVYNLNFTEWKDKMAYLGDRFSRYSIREWKKDELEDQNQRFLNSYGEYYKTTDLVDLPEYNEKTIYIPMSKNHRKIYEEVIIQDLGVQRDTRGYVNRFPYMMLSVDEPELLKKHSDAFNEKLNERINNFDDRDLEKFNALEDIIEDHKGEKIIVWILHPLTAQKTCEKFKNLNPICIIGETKQEERFKLVEEFKTGDHKLLVANITTLNTSVTILEAKVSVYFERGYNYTEFAQSQNRNYRIGQDKDITSYILVYDRSLDCLLNKNLRSKGTLVEGLCSRDFLTQDEWKTIFNCTENDEF